MIIIKINYEGDRISVDEAAEILNMNKQKLRILMQKGKLPIGVAYKSEQKGGDSYSYYIYKWRVMAYMKGLDIVMDFLKELMGSDNTYGNNKSMF